MQIQDLVRLDEKAEFRNDVQLSSYYRREQNLSLLESYMFSSTAPKEQQASLDVLNHLIETFSVSQAENRSIVLANYGHGKSHLALVLGNYFGKPKGSIELQKIFEKIESAAVDSAQAQRFKQFKESNAPFLVVCLSGDESGSLQELFLRATEKALQHHEATRDVRLPFWYSDAETFLKSLDEQEKEKANAFLADHQMDVPLLLSRVQAKDAGVHKLCKQVCFSVKGVRPDFGSEVSLKDVVGWIVNEYCGDDKPFRGLLILFDEFSMFIQRHAKQMNVGELQELLNGVSDYPAKTAFMAFSQHDPRTIAQNELKAAHYQERRESIAKELTRIPKILNLYSLMESVLDSYLYQPEEAWTTFKQMHSSLLSEAGDMVYDLFQRYPSDLNWNVEKYDETVVKGCFPLHPMTTALLCNVELQATSAGTPRRVLGFVLERVQKRAEQPAVIADRVNWVLPIELVDYFKDALPTKEYYEYENTVKQIGADAGNEVQTVLKAMLLFSIKPLSVRNFQYEEIVAQMAGLKVSEVKQTLQTLKEKNYIRFDSNAKTYGFWSSTANIHRLEEIVNTHLASITLDWNCWREIQDSALLSRLLEEIEVQVDWGAPKDWAATQTLLIREFCELNYMQSLVQSYKIEDNRGLQSGSRGAVVWLIAQDENDQDWFLKELPALLDKVSPDETCIPLVMIAPEEPCPEFLDLLRRYQALQAFTKTETEEVNGDVYQSELSRCKNSIREMTEQMMKNPATYIVPQPFRSWLQVRERLPIRDALKTCYEVAYRSCQPAFFTQYSVNTHTNLQSAVRLVARLLMDNDLNNKHALDNKIAKDMRNDFLLVKWGLLTSDYRIQPPANERVQKAWQLLEKTFTPEKAEVQVQEVLISLLNPPYGYDYNTLSILFCAWLGYNAHDLQISESGRVISLHDLSEKFAKKPRDFLNDLCYISNVAIQRRDREQLAHEIEELIKRVDRDEFTQDEAEKAISQLREFASTGSDPNLCPKAQNAARKLEDALKNARDYDQEVTRLRATPDDVSKLVTALKDIEKLPKPGNVAITNLNPAELRQELMQRVKVRIERICQNNEQITDLTKLALQQTRLQELKKLIVKHLETERVDQALETLSENAKRLQALQDEKPLHSEIQAMREDNALQALYQYRDRLRQIEGYSPETQTLRDQKLQVIEEEIVRLQQFAERLNETLDRTTDLTAVIQLHKSILRELNRYEGTPEGKALSEAQQRCEKLETFFQELQSIYQLPLPKREKELNTLKRKSGKLLNRCQQDLIQQAITNTVNEIQIKQQEACEWLHEREHEVQQAKGSWSNLLMGLESPPDWLPPSELPRLESLKQKVQDAIDADEVEMIRSHFLKIQNKEKRREVVKVLQKLLEEK